MTRRKRVGIYVRVSTADQKAEMQERELREYAGARRWEIAKVYADLGVSGANASRPALNQLFADCLRRKLDVVLVWKFDRFARSLRQLVTALEEFNRMGISFVSATEGVDTTIPSGELVFQIFGAIAQFERALISERVKAGLTQAVRNGKRLGRPPIRKLDGKEIAQVRAQHAKGVTLRELARKNGTSLWAIHQATSIRKRGL
jgi:DNA invertase Pin-like site-specific DNA recombinase